MGYRHAAAVMPRNLARLVNSTTYTAPVPQYSAEYVKAMRARDEQEFWGSATTLPREIAPLMGSRYVGGSIGTPRSR